MSRIVLVSLFCDDRVGLISGVTGTLFDQGANLRDVSFAVLGRAAEFSAVCEIPDHLEAEELRDSLVQLPVLAGAEIRVSPFDESADHDTSGGITHRVTVSGGDQPGLIARLSEIFATHDANVVELDARTAPPSVAGDGEEAERYVMRFSVWLPPERADSCLAAVANTAGSMGLTCHIDTGAAPT